MLIRAGTYAPWVLPGQAPNLLPREASLKVWPYAAILEATCRRYTPTVFCTPLAGSAALVTSLAAMGSASSTPAQAGQPGPASQEPRKRVQLHHNAQVCCCHTNAIECKFASFALTLWGCHGRDMLSVDNIVSKAGTCRCSMDHACKAHDCRKDVKTVAHLVMRNYCMSQLYCADISIS